MISREQVASYRNVILCDVHETAWLEILGTLDAALKVVEAAKHFTAINSGLSGMESFKKLDQALAPFTAPRGKA